MSAINPASFVTPPSAGLQAPNPLAYSHDTQTDRSHQHDGRMYGSARDGHDAGRDGQLGMLRSAYAEPYQSLGPSSRAPESGLGGHTSPDPFSPYSPSGYTPLDSGYVDYAAGTGASAGSSRMHPQNEWMSRFQGLSLNS